MSGKERREQILNILKDSGKPVPGVELARLLQVSRQVIVQDMALLRANGIEILSTNRGYVAVRESSFSRVFKVIHTEEQVEEELNLYVDFGGTVEDVFVYHKVYGSFYNPLEQKVSGEGVTELSHAFPCLGLFISRQPFHFKQLHFQV